MFMNFIKTFYVAHITDGGDVACGIFLASCPGHQDELLTGQSMAFVPSSLTRPM